MESIGDKLRANREEKGFSIEQIARDTNIAKRYLEALEAEDFTAFPGEPYLIGFLRNYADYLGLEPDEMVTLYRNFKIQSQPLPMDELLVKKDRKIPWIIFGAIVIIGALVAGGYFLFPVIFQRDQDPAADQPESEKPSTEVEGSIIEFQDEILERRFIEGDTIVIPFKEKLHQLELSDIAEDKVTLTVPGGTYVLRIGDERAIDLDGDAAMDVRISVNDIDTSGRDRSAVLRLDRFVKQAMPSSEIADLETGTESSDAADGVQAAVSTGTPGVPDRAVTPVIIKKSDSVEPFKVSIIFRGYCLFRYVIDGSDPEERYFHKGETIELDVNREVRMWQSNAGNMSVKVAGIEADFGRPGQVSVRIISWIRGDNTNNLVLAPLY